MDDGAAIEARVRAALDATGVPYDVIPCDPELAETAAFCERYGYPPEQSANAIVVASKKPPGRFACCVVLATARLDVNRTVRKKLGVSRASFAPPDVTRERTGMLIGGVTPFGLPADVPVWVDAAVMACEWIIVGGGSRSSKIKLAPAVFAHLPNAEVVDGLARAAAD